MHKNYEYVISKKNYDREKILIQLSIQSSKRLARMYSSTFSTIRPPLHLISVWTLQPLPVNVNKHFFQGFSEDSVNFLYERCFTEDTDGKRGSTKHCHSCHNCKDVIEPQRNNTNKMNCATSEDSDQPRHLPSLISVFAGCMKTPLAISFPYSAQQRLW